MNMQEFNLEYNLNRVKTFLERGELQRFRDYFLSLHTRDQASLFVELEEEERQVVYQFLSPQESADMFDSLEEDQEDVEDFFLEMNPQYAADLLERMYADNAVALLGNLDKDHIQQLLSHMDPESASNLRKMLQYEKETAGSIMTKEYIALDARMTIGETLASLKHTALGAETIYYLYVVDEQSHLMGVVSLRDIVTQEDEELISNVMNTNIISASVFDDQEDVAQLISDYDFLALPVIDEAGRLSGIITVDDIIDVIEDEAASDYSGLAAVDVEERTTNPIQAAASRLPWLITLLFLGIGTSTLISYFEVLVSQAAVLAVFISLITGTAGNAGTQSLAVAIRRLGERDQGNRSLGKMVLNELATGVVTGTIAGIAVFFIVGLWQQNFILGFIVAVALFFAVIMANMAGSFIPLVIEKMGFDPAVASGPFITTLSDLTSVFIYFSIATLFLPYLN